MSSRLYGCLNVLPVKLSFAFLFLSICLILYFYRPVFAQRPLCDASASKMSSCIVSPASGTVYRIQKADGTRPFIHIIILLKISDEHIQYVPMNGKVESIKYDRTGQFNIIIKTPGKSDLNEKMITHLSTEYGDVYVVQIAGRFTRRIFNFCAVGHTYEAGDPLGLIALGSRVDLFIPKGRWATAPILYIKEGDHIKGRQIIGMM